MYLCPRAVQIKTSYEASIEKRAAGDDHAQRYENSILISSGDKRAMARALHKHAARCRSCSF